MDSGTDIHPSAMLHPTTQLGFRVRIDSGALVEKDVRLGEGVHVMSRAVIGQGCQIEAGCILFPGCVLVGGRPSSILVGEGTVLREHVVIYGGCTECPTVIGSSSLLMGGVYIGPGCQIGHGVVMGNGTVLCDKVHLGDQCVVGGLSYISGGNRIGRFAMVGGMSQVLGNVLPFSTSSGSPARSCGLNTIGLRRAGFSDKMRMDLKRAYRMVFLEGIDPEEAYLRLLEKMDVTQEVIEFMEALRFQSDVVL